MRLIDLDRTCSELERFYNGYTGELRRVASEALDLVCMMPEVDPESLRPKGRWEYYSTTMQECSACKRHTARHKYDYCPRCGADMREG